MKQKQGLQSFTGELLFTDCPLIVVVGHLETYRETEDCLRRWAIPTWSILTGSNF